MTIHVHGGPRAFQLAATIGVTLLSACSGASRERAPLNIDHPLVPLVLSPGSGALQPLHARPDARARLLGRAATGDTTEQVLSEIRREERADEREATSLALIMSFSPPFASVDSLVVDPRTIAPLTEVLRVRGDVIRIRYDGPRITGSVQHGDSTPVPFAVTASEVPFAFNALDPIVRSLPLRAGFQAVVPLFSEIDRLVERDTLSVLEGERNALGGTVWRIRFADAVIVSTYGVDGNSREIVSQEVTNRRSGRRFRYLPLLGGP